MYTEIRCSNCFAVITAEEIDTQAEMAECLDCGNRFSIKKNIREDIRKKRFINQPEYADTVVIGKHSLDLEILYNFTQKTTKFTKYLPRLIQVFRYLPSLVIMPFILMICLYISASENTLWPIFIFFILLIAAITYITHDIISHKRNSNYLISIKDGYLSITNPQFPLPKKFYTDKGIVFKKKDSTLSTENINQLYVKELDQQNKKHHIYELMILTADGSHLSPFFPFFNLTDALYVEQEIERFLSIRDFNEDLEIQT